MAHLTLHIPRTARALKGWHHAAPPQQRMPVPIQVVGAIIGVFLHQRLVESSLRLFIQFMNYMRPGECSALMTKQLIAPIQPLNQAFNFWAVLLHPADDLIPGKTGVFDSSVLIDSDLWINQFLMRLVRAKAGTAPVSKSICSSIPSPQTSKSRPDTVRPQTWRCNSRCAVKTEEHIGSEAVRKVGNGHFIETIHQRSKIANRVEQGARSCKGVRSEDHAKPTAAVRQSFVNSTNTVWNPAITKRMISRAYKPNLGPRSLSGSALLKRLFRSALKKCTGKFHGVFLDIFSGDGGG